MTANFPRSGKSKKFVEFLQARPHVAGAIFMLPRKNYQNDDESLTNQKTSSLFVAFLQDMTWQNH